MLSCPEWGCRMDPFTAHPALHSLASAGRGACAPYRKNSFCQAL